MADLEEVVQHVSINTADAENAFKHLGEVGAEAFAQIFESASKGEFTGLATLIGGELAGGFTKAAEAALEFVHSQGEAVQKLAELAEASGSTLSQFEGLSEAFASVGISTQAFERSMGHLAQMVNNSWSSIQQSVRTSSEAQEGAHLHVQQAALNTERAYNAMGQAISDISRQSAHDINDVAGAQLSLERAQLNQLKNLQGQQAPIGGPDAGKGPIQTYDPTASQEKLLKQREDALSVSKASQAINDIINKQSEDAINAVEKLKQKQLDLAKTKLAEREAGEKSHEVDLRDIPKISEAIDSVAKGYTSWKDHADLAEVSAQNLAKGVIKAASVGSERPKNIDVLNETAELFKNLGNDAEAMNIKVEIAQHLFGTGFRAGTASASQFVAILSKGKDELEAFQKRAEISPFKLSDKEIESIKGMNAAYAELGAAVNRVGAKLAALASPALTAFFKAIESAIERAGKALKEFASSDEGKAIEEMIGKIGQALKDFSTSDVGKAAFQVLAEVVKQVAKDIEGIARGINSVIEQITKMTGLKPEQVWTVMGAAIATIAIALTGVLDKIALLVAKTQIWAGVIGLVLVAIGKMLSLYDAISQKKTFDEAQKTNPILQAGLGLLSTASGGLSEKIPGLGPTAAKAGETSSNASDALARDLAARSAATGTTGTGGAGLSQAANKTEAAAEKTGTSAGKMEESAAAHKEAASLWMQIGALLNSKIAQPVNQPAAQAQPTPGAAGGGEIQGPGGPRSDTAGLFALSNGEFVVQAAAVQRYGTALFHSLNSMAVGGLAMGGLVPSSSSISVAGTAPGKASSIINLAIDGNHFNGLTAPDHVAAKLKSYAVSRQTTAAGRNPSWMR